MTASDTSPAVQSVTAELLPCPFCGVAATVEHPVASIWSVGCEAIDCDINPFAGGSNRSIAVRQWNRRAAQVRAGLDGEVGRLRAEMVEVKSLSTARFDLIVSLAAEIDILQNEFQLSGAEQHAALARIKELVKGQAFWYKEYTAGRGTLAAALTCAAKAEAANERLRSVLRPFADRAAHLEPDWLDHECHWHPAVGSPVTVGDLRRAAALLADPATDAGGDGAKEQRP